MGEYKKGHFTHAQIKKGDAVYMDRWYILVFPRLFSIRIHHIMLPDMDRWPHDHPWSFLSIIVRGGYLERWCGAEDFKLFAGEPSSIKRGLAIWSGYKTKHVRRLSFHRNTDLHKIVKFKRAERGAWTLIFTGPERREWGFMTDQGWVSRVALNLGASAPRQPHGPEPD